MKNQIIAAVTFSALSATTAFAGNVDTAFLPLAETESVGIRDWSGHYAGAAVGLQSGLVGTTDVNSIAVGAFVVQDIETSGFASTLIAGYNFQSGSIVYGIEADYSFGGPSGSSIVDTIGLDETLEWETNWSYSIRGRVGLATNDWLIFGTAGVANSNAHFGYLDMDPAGIAIENDSRETRTVKGWVAGLGVERAIGENLVLRGEALYTELEYQEFDTLGPNTALGYAAGFTEVRVGALWSF